MVDMKVMMARLTVMIMVKRRLLTGDDIEIFQSRISSNCHSLPPSLLLLNTSNNNILLSRVWSSISVSIIIKS